MLLIDDAATADFDRSLSSLSASSAAEATAFTRATYDCPPTMSALALMTPVFEVVSCVYTGVVVSDVE